ncbi:prolyl oligopeptidase family serine peptidase [Flavobacterium sp. TP390]|uniref:Prolyl oligopeptidase family serine peptidase n=1 Tax=Flavobacterium profundi TaxID=1774945 RepID=A0A6I4IV54_9FLAO|nr:S9 family peptidase [Flavobacterium profundi]MVO10741.1 prolyl oligopeptidase family serine peptidase [Flavobacterium profundi]
MTSKKITLLILLIASYSIVAQQKITLEEIWTGAFRTKGMDELHALKNTNQYTVLDFDRASRSMQIDLYDFETLEKVTTLINTKDFPELESIDNYAFDQSETKILLATHSSPIFRHSFTADYFVYDTKTKSLYKFTNNAIQEPTFSSDGSKIAYAFENNLYVYDTTSKTNLQITQDGQKNKIINGITDWVYEEEFAFVKAFDWNKTGDKIAYIRFDESEVPEFSMDLYNEGLYPSQYVFKYPKAGEKNATVSLHVYDLKTNTSSKINLGNYTDFYIPRIQWTNEANILSAQVMNRHQNNLDLHFIDASSGKTNIVLNEKDKAYIDITDNLTFLSDNSFIWTSEKDGYNHIYHYDKNGKLLNQVTKGNWEVTAYYGFDEKNKTIYFQSVENGSINRDIYSIHISGKKKNRLTSKTGTNDATFSPNFQLFINTYSSATHAPLYTLNDSKTGKELKVIQSNEALESKVAQYNIAPKTFFTLTTEKGHTLNAWSIKPKDFDASKKYPVLMYQYSGPGSQQVANQWNSSNDYWYYMLAQKGYIVICVDGRGTGFKGAEFKKCTYKELGKYEVEDQINAAKVIAKYEYVDASRIGIWGWSYGGFMSSNCILKGNDVFKTAIAVAPVTSWRYYDSIYTERYMQTPQENASGYDDNSPINHVNKLKGNYLLVHGTADDNVHVQNTMKMIEALVQANKQFDWAIYPDKNHGIYGGKTRLQLYTKMTNFIINNL